MVGSNSTASQLDNATSTRSIKMVRMEILIEKASIAVLMHRYCTLENEHRFCYKYDRPEVVITT